MKYMLFWLNFAEISSQRSDVCTIFTDAFTLIIISGRRSALYIFVVNSAFTAMMFIFVTVAEKSFMPYIGSI